MCILNNGRKYPRHTSTTLKDVECRLKIGQFSVKKPTSEKGWAFMFFNVGG